MLTTLLLSHGSNQEINTRLGSWELATLLHNQSFPAPCEGWFRKMYDIYAIYVMYLYFYTCTYYLPEVVGFSAQSTLRYLYAMVRAGVISSFCLCALSTTTNALSAPGFHWRLRPPTLYHHQPARHNGFHRQFNGTVRANPLNAQLYPGLTDFGSLNWFEQQWVA